MKTRSITTKRPWRIVRPDGYLAHGASFAQDCEPAMPADTMISDILTQADMLRMYYPSGHVINDPRVYPDIYREVDEPVRDAEGKDTGRTVRRVYRECVPRYAFAFQQIIALKQVIHATGNDVQFELNAAHATVEQQERYDDFREGWLGKDSEIALYDSVRSEKITADCAVAGFLEDGVFGWQPLSFLTGSTLYPHYDRRGRLRLLGRKFYDYDEDGNVVVEWLEVWDTRNYYLLRRSGEKYRGVLERVLAAMGAEGYSVVKSQVHGFPFVPVAYKRNEGGPCWMASQDSCDAYDMSFSQMAHNNQAYGVPAMVLQGEGENYDFQHDLNGTLRTVSMGPEDKVSMLQAESASESYHKQLDTLYRMIYEQSFAVIPPEVHSGDLPGVAVKMLYSPALEKAMADAAEWQPFLNDMVRIFAYGYGVERGCTIDFMTLPLRYWIKPYVHVNESAVMADLALGVNSGFISRQTASERAPEYTSVGEWERIVREQKEEQQADLLYQMKMKRAGAAQSQKGEAAGDE